MISNYAAGFSACTLPILVDKVRLQYWFSWSRTADTIGQQNLLVCAHLEAVRVLSVPCTVAFSAKEGCISGLYRWVVDFPQTVANLTWRIANSSTKKVREWWQSCFKEVSSSKDKINQMNCVYSNKYEMFTRFYISARIYNRYQALLCRLVHKHKDREKLGDPAIGDPWSSMAPQLKADL